VAAGGFAGLVSPISTDPAWATPVDLLDITLAAGAALDLPLANNKNAFLIITAGALISGEDEAHQQQTVLYAPAVPGDAGRSVLSLVAGLEGARAVFAARHCRLCPGLSERCHGHAGSFVFALKLRSVSCNPALNIPFAHLF
jgi:hypothetical protein